MCGAAYGFLSAYAVHVSRTEQLADRQDYLQELYRRHQELVRKQAAIKQIRSFSDQAAALKLGRSDWLFYDVHVQGGFSFEAAQQIIGQCNDSPLAYYWPISLEVTTPGGAEESNSSAAKEKALGDVQLTVKGQFVARSR